MKLRLISREPISANPTPDTKQLHLRPPRLRFRRGNRLVPVKNSASARNAVGKAIILKHAGDSRALRLGRFDLRSTMGKEYRDRVAALVAHLGGVDAVSTPQRTLVARAARLGLLVEIMWDELSRTGALSNGDLTSAFHGFLRAVGDEERVLRLLGIERRARTVPDLDAYLRAKRPPRLLDSEES